MPSSTVGRWSAISKGNRSFADEVAHAVTIGARWGRTKHQREIVLDDIPGWLSPLWGSDDCFLYIRRPEGIWKAEIPHDFENQTPILLSQNRVDSSGSRVIGSLFIGNNIFARNGWHQGPPINNGINAFDIDDLARPSIQDAKVEADAIGQDLWEVLPFENGDLLVKAGDDFCSEPHFSINGDWLIAKDKNTGWRIAYSVEKETRIHQALLSGRLWLQYRSPWLRKLNVKVSLPSVTGV
jgi:hypothetical protein